MNLNELRATRGDHIAACEKLIVAARAAGKDVSGADLAEYDNHIREIKNIDQIIARSEALTASMGGPYRDPVIRVGFPSNGDGPVVGRDSHGQPVAIFDKDHSVAAYLRTERGAEQENGVTLGAIVRAMALGGGSREVRAALAEGTDSAGGYTVPSIVLGNIIDALRARSVAFQAGARAVLLETGKPTSVAVITGDATAAWRAENADVTVSDMTFGAVSFTPRSLACIVVASDEVFEDSLNIDQAIQRSLSASLGGELDRVALIGSGTPPEPKGVTRFSGVGSYPMGDNGAALADYSPFIEALGVLQTANAMDPTACIIAPRTAKAIGLLQDTTDQPLQRPKPIENLPFLVTSRLPINETQGSSNAASRAIMGYFPDLLIGIRHDLRIQILREKYRDKLQIGVLADLRADVAVAHAASFCNIVGIL